MIYVLAHTHSKPLNAYRRNPLELIRRRGFQDVLVVDVSYLGRYSLEHKALIRQESVGGGDSLLDIVVDSENRQLRLHSPQHWAARAYTSKLKYAQASAWAFIFFFLILFF